MLSQIAWALKVTVRALIADDGQAISLDRGMRHCPLCGRR